MFICGGSAPGEALRILTELARCCVGALEEGPASCTCWTAEYDLEQMPPDPTLTASTRSSMCDDCAFLPTSPERSGDDRYMCATDENGGLPSVPAGGVFWCHQGMRKVVRWRHPSGITVDADGDFYKPPMREIGEVLIPFKADGTPGERCAGWDAHRQRDGALVGQLAKAADQAPES